MEVDTEHPQSYMFTLLTVEKDTHSRLPLLVVERDTPLRPHWRYSLMPTLLTVEN